jgi:hypothetical protein
VEPHSVIVGFDPFEDALAGLGAGLIGATVHHFVFQTARFHERIVVTTGFAAHAGLEALPKVGAGILHARSE